VGELGEAFDFALEGGSDAACAVEEVVGRGRLRELKALLAERTHLLEPQPLKDRLAKLQDSLNFMLRDIDSVGLTPEYSALLDEN
jgi:hypothetical protein